MTRYLCICYWFLLLCAGAARAQEILTSAREITSLDVHRAVKQPTQVKLRAVASVVGFLKNSFVVTDSTGSVGVMLPPGVDMPELYDEVEIEGNTLTYVTGIQGNHKYSRVSAKKVNIVGKGAAPKATRLTVDEVNTFEHFDQWVSTDGQVIRWRYAAPELEIAIAGAKAWTTVSVQVSKRPDDLITALVGARIRITGQNMHPSHSEYGSMVVPSVDLVEVLEPGHESIFEAPVVSISDAVSHKVPHGARVRVKGTLLAQKDELSVYLRGESGAISCGLEPPSRRAKRQGEENGGIVVSPVLTPGDEVELVGFRMESLDESSSPYVLQHCQFRVLGHSSEVEPIDSTIPEVVAGKWTHDLVSVRGRLLTLQQVPVDHGDWRTTMMLEADGTQIPLSYLGKGRTRFRSLNVNDELVVTALVENGTARDPRQLWAVSEGDIVSRGISPVVRTQQALWWAGAAVVALAAMSGWIVALRKSNTAHREAASLLEKRVNERTIELSKAQADLTKALEQERELGELKSRFVAMVSHEFRTPLGITMSAVELLRHYEEKLPPAQRRELCDDIHEATNNMAKLMEQVLLLGKVEAGKLAFRPAAMNLPALIVKLTDEISSATNAKCPISWQSHGILEGARGDESLLRHVIGNLITNAVKYSPAGAEVIVTANRDHAQLVLSVIDQGIGIPEEDQRHLFEAFHRGSNVGDTPGTGLGLVIVKRCVDLHGGTLELKSKPGQGSTFTLRVPVFEIQ